MIPLAHGIGGRSDLPVPLWLALYGAAAAVLISFFALLAFWPDSKLGGRAGRVLPSALQQLAGAPATWIALRTLGLVSTAGFVAVNWFGPADPAHNPAPTWFYVWFWVGLVPASILFGPVWCWLNPLRPLAAGVRALAVFLARGRIRWPRLPESVGYRPAAVSLFGFVWLELVYDHADAPASIAAFLGGYAIIHAGAGAVYGPRWFDRGDGFEAYSALLGSLAPVGRRADGRLALRNPLGGLAAQRPAPGLVATVSVLLGSTGFDGLSRTRIWRILTADADRLLYLALGTAGLLAAIGFVMLTYSAATRMSRRYLRSPDGGAVATRFVHSLVPICVGYTVAHYFSFAVFQGQAGYLLATDPLGRGWDLFGLAGRAIDYTAVSPRAIAAVQVAAIVLGHVIGVVVAHDRAVAVLERRHRRRAQYGLLAVMVGYTVGGISLVVGT
jgi:hypothetical protein